MRARGCAGGVHYTRLGRAYRCACALHAQACRRGRAPPAAVPPHGRTFCSALTALYTRFLVTQMVAAYTASDAVLPSPFIVYTLDTVGPCGARDSNSYAWVCGHE